MYQSRARKVILIYTFQIALGKRQECRENKYIKIIVSQ